MPIRKAENDLVVEVENGPSRAAGAILNGQRSARAGSAGSLGTYASISDIAVA